MISISLENYLLRRKLSTNTSGQKSTDNQVIEEDWSIGEK